MLLLTPEKTILRTHYEICHRDVDGAVVWSEDSPNRFHQAGEEFVLKVLFSKEESAPSAYYIGLSKTADTPFGDITSVSEPSGNGYSRQSVPASSFEVVYVPPHYRAYTKKVTFVASGGAFDETKWAFLSTADSGGFLISSVEFSQPRTLADGESLDVSLYIEGGS